MYQELVKSFQETPRDVHTVPQRGQYIWFHVSVEQGSLVVEPAHINKPSSNVRRRKLQKKDVSAMLELYHRRQRGEPISTEAKAVSASQVYWYGIFADMKW